MDNEVLARAMSGIDDDLIEEASKKPVKPRRVYRWVTVAAAAVCVVVICTVVMLMQGRRQISASAYGSLISETSVPVDAPAQSGARSSQNIISVPIEFSGNGDIEISAIDGTVAVSGAKINDLLYGGQSLTVEAPVTAWWNISQPDTSQAYRLKLNGGIILLYYDKGTEQWLLQKQ